MAERLRKKLEILVPPGMRIWDVRSSYHDEIEIVHDTAGHDWRMAKRKADA